MKAKGAREKTEKLIDDNLEMVKNMLSESNNSDEDEGIKAMNVCFEGMNDAFINGLFSAENVDYELEKKMQIFSNLSILLARIFEYRGESNEAVRVCDTLL